MTNSLRGKTITGLFWTFSEMIMNQGVQFFIQIILARLLLPEDFGVIGMITIFISLANSLIDSGFSNALIREKKVTQEEYSTVFYFNFITAIVIYVVLFITSPLISSFFNEYKLIAILRIISLTIIVNSFGLIQKTMLSRNIDFKTQTKISVTASLVSGLIGVFAAVMGLGVWSLVIRTLFMSIIQSILLCLHNKWIPSFVFDKNAFKRLFGFGWKLMISGLVNTLYDNLYYLIIGRGFSASELGYYTNATKLRDTVSQSITTSIQKVSYPVLSNISDVNEKLKYGYKKIIKNAAFIIFPVMIGLSSIGNVFIPILLGENWISSIVYFQILCLAGMLYPIHAINLNVLQVKGRSDLFLKVEIIKKVISIVLISMVLVLGNGIIDLLWVAVVNSFISYFINAYYSKNLINYSIKEQVNDILPMLITSSIMGIVVHCIGIVMKTNNLFILVIQLILGVMVYYGFNKLIKCEELNEIENLLRKILIRNSKNI